MTEPIIYKDDGEYLTGSKTLKGSFGGVNAKLTTISPSLKEPWCTKEYDPNARPDYSKMYFIFQFKDGQEAKYRMDKDCHTLEQFLDRMNHFHELEKENKRLQKQIKEANKAIKTIRKTVKEGEFPCDACGYSMACDDCWCGYIADEYLKKWGVK